jgi:hypothetical protein
MEEVARRVKNLNAIISRVRNNDSVQLVYGVMKRIPLGESGSLQFRVEAFNLFNHPSFSNPSNTFGVAGFGTTSIPREIQFAIKGSF